MTDADYERERTALREAYGDNRQEAGARFEQELARLFYRFVNSGWTQENLAKKEGCKQPTISQALQFGRFLDFIAAGNNPTVPANFSRKAFRGYWERTDKAESNERIRFTAVLALLESSTPTLPKRPKIGKAIIDKFADGKWHKVDDIAKVISPEDVSHVADTLRHPRAQAIAANAKYNRQVRRRKIQRRTAATTWWSLIVLYG